MYSVTENITQNAYQVSVTEQGSTYSVTVNENVSSYAVTIEQQIRMLPNLELEQRIEDLETDSHTHSNKPLLDGIDQDLSSTANVNFDSIQLNGGDGTQGTLSWNTDEETLDLVQNGAVLQLGQELQYHVRNNSGVDINDGDVVMATGTLGNSGRITVAKANTNDAKYILGIATENILNDSDGKVTHFGKVRGINTTGVTYGETWSDGDILYYKATGALTNVEPATGLKMPLAIVVHAHSHGSIFVRVTNIDENAFGDDVQSWMDIAGNIRYTGVETTVTNGQVLTGIYNGSTIYRFINDANDIYGYPIEDSFYQNFDGTNLSGLIKTRG